MGNNTYNVTAQPQPLPLQTEPKTAKLAAGLSDRLELYCSNETRKVIYPKLTKLVGCVI